MPISTVNQKGLDAPLTLTSPVLSGTTTATTVTSPAATALTLQSASTTAVTINTSQNVGIGTTSPTHKLTIGYSNADSSNKIAVGNVSGYQGLLDYNNGNEVFTVENTTDYSIGGINFKVNGADRGFFDINGNFKFNSGFGSVATAYGCRAWINFNGITNAIRASAGVSSITDRGTGNWDVNFSFSMPDANYSAQGSRSYRGVTNFEGNATNYARVYCAEVDAPYLFDPEFVYVAVFR